MAGLRFRQTRGTDSGRKMDVYEWLQHADDTLCLLSPIGIVQLLAPEKIRGTSLS